jgi:hypothetical protein
MAWLMMEQEMVDTELAIKTCLKVCTVVERESPGPWILDPEEESWNFSVHLFFLYHSYPGRCPDVAAIECPLG